MRILYLGTDSFGGYGGIALYSRELIAALASYPGIEEVVVVPRIILGPLEPIPHKVTFVKTAASGRLAYLNALRTLQRPFDLVICAHINLLPVARLFTRRSVLFSMASKPGSHLEARFPIASCATCAP